MVPRSLPRRTVLALSGGALAGCVGSYRRGGEPTGSTRDGSPGGQAAPEASWPQLGKTAGHTGYSRSMDGAEPTLQWSVETDGILTTPTVAAATVYVTRGEPTGDGPEATLEAYGLDDGSRRWTASLDTTFRFNAPFSNHRPIYHRGKVYVCDEEAIVAIDAGTRERRWRVAPEQSVNDPPTVTDDAVYVTTFAPERLVSLAHDGTERWRYPDSATPASGQDPPERTSIGVPAIVGDTVYASTDEGLVALDAADGSERWRHDGAASRGSSVAATDGSIVQTGIGRVEAVAPDGTRRWETRFEEASIRPAVADGTAYVAGLEGTVLALNLDSGDEQWRASVGPTEWAQGTVPAVTRDAVHVLRVGDGEVTVYALDRQSGDVQWTVTKPGNRGRGPVPAMDSYLVATQDWPDGREQSKTVSQGVDSTATLRAFAP